MLLVYQITDKTRRHATRADIHALTLCRETQTLSKCEEILIFKVSLKCKTPTLFLYILATEFAFERMMIV